MIRAPHKRNILHVACHAGKKGEKNATEVLKALSGFPDALETLLVQRDVWLQTPVDLCTKHKRRVGPHYQTPVDLLCTNIFAKL